MLIVVKEGELTERKKLNTYEYMGYFKIINRISKILENIEQLDEYMEEEEKIQIKNYIEDFNTLLDRIDGMLKKANKIREQEKPIWAGGSIKEIYINNKKNKKRK